MTFVLVWSDEDEKLTTGFISSACVCVRVCDERNKYTALLKEFCCKGKESE